MPQYKRPPITEAVIEVRFEGIMPRREVDDLQSKFKSEYPFSDNFVALGLEVDLDERRAKFDEQSAGYRLASADRADVLLVTSRHMTCSRLAPYLGWDSFRQRAYQDWLKWKRLSGYRKVSRIGVRYINRIDIPATSGDKVQIKDYLKVYPEAKTMDLVVNYTMQLVGPLGTDDCKLVINSRTVQSPLVDRFSVVFDIDVSRDTEVPQRDEEIWSLIDRIRTHKNRVFETSITDRSRELFNT